MKDSRAIQKNKENNFLVVIEDDKFDEEKFKKRRKDMWKKFESRFKPATSEQDI